MRQPFSGTAERIFIKLLPNDRGPRIIFWGLKTDKSRKIAISAYRSELITPELKRIFERLKRLWDHKTMAYKVYVRP